VDLVLNHIVNGIIDQLLGFIGKNLVEYILQNDLASKVRVVDKKVVSTALLSTVSDISVGTMI
jgi:hypothetical protein